jgi:Predicted multitransmembrane protein
MYPYEKNKMTVGTECLRSFFIRCYGYFDKNELHNCNLLIIELGTKVMIKMYRQNKTAYLVVLVLSILFLYVGNRIAEQHKIDIVIQSRESELDDQVFAQVLKVNSTEPDQTDTTRKIVKFTAKITGGKNDGQIVQATQYSYINNSTMPPAVDQNDKVVLGKLSDGQVTEWAFENYERIDQIVILFILLTVLILIFGGKKGVQTVITLTLTCLSIFYVFIPLILSGFSIYFSTVLVCIYVICVTFLLTGGINRKSLAAAIGCIGGVIFSGSIYLVFNHTMKLTGFYNDQSSRLMELFANQPINLHAVVFAMVTIGALGATMDVAMSIASSLDEIKSGRGGRLSRYTLIKSGLSIGRDIMGTMMNTLILAYVGSSLVTLIIYAASNYPILQLLNQEEIIVEFLESLVGSLGMLLTIPFTTFISAMIWTEQDSQSPALVNRPRNPEAPLSKRIR